MVDVLDQQVGRTAADLRAATLDVHLATEQNAFIVELMAGRRSAVDLARLTGQLRSVYAALETTVVPHRADPLFGRLFDPRLDRLSTIDHDLTELAGSAAAALVAPLPETLAYVDRIRDIADEPERLVAHHYVRYLGDLSGGQIIAMLMRRHYRLPDEALTFYAFVGLPSKGGFKTTYRRTLDELFRNPKAYAVVVEESRTAYEANRRVFEALGAPSGARARASVAAPPEGSPLPAPAA
jgi:heme oxygenase